MSLADVGMSAADLAAIVGNNNDGSFGNNGAWWLLILLLVFGNGWGNNNGAGNGNGGGYGGYVVSDVQRGFDQSAVMSALSAITASLSSAEVSRCNGQTNILEGINSLGQNLSTQLNTIAMNQQTCCCNTRETVNQGIQSVLTGMNNGFVTLGNQLNSGFVTLGNQINAGIQSIQDKLCQQEIDALKAQLATANTQLNLANLRESQTAQTAAILANNAAQTAALEQYLNPPAVPAYIVQNPNCCAGNSVYAGCGCNVA